MFAVCAALAVGAPGVWLDVPFVRQEHNGCGAACISMLLQYWKKSGGSQPGKIYAEDMARHLQEDGFRTFIFRGEWTDLRDHLSKGRPLIVALKPGSFHYVVVAGMDWQQEIVLLNDPAQKKLLKMKRTSFESEWRGTGNWTLLALPK